VPPSGLLRAHGRMPATACEVVDPPGQACLNSSGRIGLKGIYD